MCSDKNGNTIFGDFLTGEVRSILESKKKSVRVDKFMSSSDNYSVAVLLDDNKNTFYIFYLQIGMFKSMKLEINGVVYPVAIEKKKTTKNIWKWLIKKLQSIKLINLK